MIRDLFDPLTLIVDVLAAFRLTRLITRDTWPPVKAVRDWLLRRWPSADAEYPASDVTIRDVRDEGTLPTGVPVFNSGGRWLAVRPHWLGELVTCPWCAGFWVAAAVVAAQLWLVWWPPVALVFALSAATGLIARHLDA